MKCVSGSKSNWITKYIWTVWALGQSQLLEIIYHIVDTLMLSVFACHWRVSSGWRDCLLFQLAPAIQPQFQKMGRRVWRPLLLLCALLCQYCVPSVHSLSSKSQRTNPAKYTINEMLIRFRCLIPHCIYKCVSCQPSSSSAKLPLPANVSLTPVCSLIIPITTMRVEITCLFEIRSKYE